jgi:hypothetical protein
LINENKCEGNLRNMIDKNYKLNDIDILGEGGYGIVLKCFDEARREFNALKI